MKKYETKKGGVTVATVVGIVLIVIFFLLWFSQARNIYQSYFSGTQRANQQNLNSQLSPSGPESLNAQGKIDDTILSGGSLSSTEINGINLGDFLLATKRYVNPAWLISLQGSKINGNISGNASNVTGVVGIKNGGTGKKLELRNGGVVWTDENSMEVLKPEDGLLRSDDGELKWDDTDYLTRAYAIIQNEGSALSQRSTLDFTGSGVNCVDNGEKTVCSVNSSGGGVALGPNSADIEATGNPSIWINDTGGGNLLQLQSDGTDQFVISDSGVITTGIWNGEMIGAPYLPSGISYLGSSINLASEITGILPVANGGTGTAGGSITGSGALTFAAGGANQNVTLTPSGSGYTILNGNVGVGLSNPNASLTVNGVLSLAETSSPTATSGFGKIFVNSDNARPYFQDSTGTNFDLTRSHAGVDSVYPITELGSGSFSVPDNTGTFLVDSGYQSFNIAGGSFTLADNTTSFIVAYYNNGHPEFQVITDESLIDYVEYLPYGEVVKRAGSGGVHTQLNPMYGYGEVEKMHERIDDTARYARESGLDTITVNSDREYTVNGGTVWSTNTEYAITDSTINPASGTRQYFNYHSGGNWVAASSRPPKINNTQFDNGTDLQTLTDGYYTINYIFRGIEEEDHIYLMLDSQEYANIAAAQSDKAIPELPDLISSHAMLVGRVIVQKNATSNYIIESVFGNFFQGASFITSHSNLTDLTADDHTQYALLNGRSGGQVLIGGTDANDVLTFQGNNTTGNTATDANLIFNVGDDAATRAMTILNNGNIGIGTGTFDAINPEKLLVDAGITSSVNAIYAKGTINSYFQNNIQNLSNGNQASSDVVATANNGTETTNFIDMGINGSGYIYQLGNPIMTGKANDGYLLSAGNDFYIVNNNATKDILFLTGGTATENEQMRILSTGEVGIGTDTPLGQLHIKIPAGEVTATNYGTYISNASTNTTTDGIDTYGLYVDSTGSFTGSDGADTRAIGIYANVSGADLNYPGIFMGGNVGIGTEDPEEKLTVYNGDIGVGLGSHTTFNFLRVYANHSVRDMYFSYVPGLFGRSGYDGVTLTNAEAPALWGGPEKGYFRMLSKDDEATIYSQTTIASEPASLVAMYNPSADTLGLDNANQLIFKMDSSAGKEGRIQYQYGTGSAVDALVIDPTNGTTNDVKYVYFPNGNVGIGTATPGQKLTVDGALGILEGGLTPTLHTIFQGGDQAGNITYTLPIASTNGLLRNTAGVWSWDASAYINNPMTTLGDLIYGGASGAPTALAGSAGFLTSTGAAIPAWTAAGTDYFTQYALLVGRDGGQTLTGGTAADSTLTIRGNNTVGNTATNANLIFKVGNNAGTTAMQILNNGSIHLSSSLGILESTGAIYYTTLQSGDQGGNIAYTLPTTSANGLLKNTAGAWSWDETVYQDTSEKNDPDGYAGLDAEGLLSKTQTLNTVRSSGFVNHQALVEAGGGEVTVASDDVYFYENGIFGDKLVKYTLTGGTTGVEFDSLPDETTSYLVAKYNAGLPVFDFITDRDLIDYQTYIPRATIYRSGTHLHIQEWELDNSGMAERIAYRWSATEQYRRESGLDVSIQDGSGPEFKISEGVAWTVTNRYELPEHDYNDSSFFCYHSSGDWQCDYRPASTDLNNTQYDNGTNLTALTTADKYTINYIYRGVEDQDHVYLVLSDSEYDNEAAALAAGKIAVLPDLISSHAVLVGRVIIKKDAAGSTATIQSAFSENFSNTASISSHGSLADLLSDDHTQYALLAGRTGGQILIGGADVTDDLIFQTTAASAVAGADMIFQTGNDGGTEAMRILYDGTVNVATKIGILESAGATFHTYFQGGDQGADVTYTLPTAAPGGNGYALTATTGGVMSWTNVATNPMTEVGDLIYGDTGGAPARLDAAAGFLKSDGASAPAWSSIADGDLPAALTGKTYNGLTITASTGTLTIANGETFNSGGNSLVFTTSADTTLTLPTTGTLATVAGSEALTGKTYNGLTLAAAADGFTIAGGTVSRTLTVTGANVSVNQDLQTTNSPTFAGMTLNGTLVLGANSLTTSNNTKIDNLNADLLDGNEASAFSLAGHAHSNLTQGTGISSFTYDGTTARTVGFDYSYTLAGNPTLLAGQTVFDSGDNSGAGGILFEGVTANNFEGLLTLIDPTADRTWKLQNNSGTIPLATDGNTIFFTTTGNTGLTLPTSGTVTALGNSSTGSGNIVLADSPSLTNPSLGAATASSINGIVISSGNSTLSLEGDLTTSGANALTFTTTGPTNVTLPTSGTLATNLQSAYNNDADGSDVDVAMTAADGSIIFKNTTGTQFQVAMASATAPTVDLMNIINGTGTQTNEVDGLQIDFATAAVAGTVDNAGLRLAINPVGATETGDKVEAIDIENITNPTGATTGIKIGTGWDTGISIASGGITITNGALAINNSTGITSNQATLVIDAGTTLDVQDVLNADSLTTDAGGVSITDTVANPSILANDTGGGNLLQLQVGGVDKFVIDNSGVVTGGTYNTATLSGGSLSSTAVNGVTTANILLSTGSYANPSWITSLAASKVGLGSVENTALSTWAGSSNITTVGTVTGGTYNTATLSGGSLSSTAVNGVTTANILLSTGSYANPSWITSLAASKVGLGSVENTALSTWAGSSNITTVGTVTGGTYNTATLSGGSLSSTAVNGVTTANILLSTGSYANPSWITSLAASKVGLGSVENTALSTWAGSSNITTVGTVTGGTYNTATLSGGSLSSTAVNGVTTANILLSTGSYANPSWITSLAASKVGLGSVENTALSTWAGSSNITTVGTVTGGLTIAGSQSYTGAGAVTLSSAAASGLTINSGTTGTIAIGDDASAETINISTGGAVKTLTLGSTNTTSTTNLQSGSGGIGLQANGTGTGNVQIGDGGAASATPDLLVMDIGSAEPAGTNGAMYYSTALNKFRCYENGAWTNCIGGGTGTSGTDLQTASTQLTPATLTGTTSATANNLGTVSVTPSTATGDIYLQGYLFLNSLSTSNQTITGEIRTGNTCNAGSLVSSKTSSLTSNTNADGPGLFVTGLVVDPGASAQTYVLCAYTNSASGVSAGGTFTALVVDTGADLAEFYTTNDETMEEADLVQLDPSLKTGVKKAKGVYDTNVIGIIATRPGLVMGNVDKEGEKALPVALSGRVPVKVTVENGPIKAGDYLTSSSTPGYAMKATKAGMIIGQAMTSWSGDETGKVLVFIKNTYFAGEELANNDRAISDEKLLGETAAISNALQTVISLRGVSYNTGDQESFGFVAQEVEKTLPFLVATDANGLKSLDYSKLAPLLVEAVKEQQNQIVNQESRIVNQESQFADLNLKTDQNITTLSELQVSIDKQLGVVESFINVQKEINARQESTETKMASLENLAEVLQSQLAELESKLNTETNLAQIDLQTQDLAFLKLLLGTDRVKNPEDVDVLGRLSVKTLSTGGIEIAVVDEDAPTIGQATIRLADDNNDGKSVEIKTKAVSKNSRIFFNFEDNPGAYSWSEKMEDSDSKDYSGFKIKLSNPVEKEVKVDWWIVDEK